MRALFRSILTGLLVIFFFIDCRAEEASPSRLVLEIHSKDGIKTIVIQPDEIIKVGINERGEPRVEMEIAQKYHAELENLMKENIEQQLVIRTDTDTIFSGTIMLPAPMGKFFFTFKSVEAAENAIRKMGRKADYVLQYTPEELEAGKKLIAPYKSQWANKAMAASANRDYTKAEEYAKKAIEEDSLEGKYHWILSTIYYFLGKKKLALEEGLTAERLAKKEDLERIPGIYLNMADLYEEFGEYEKATEYLQKILSNDEHNAYARLRLAKIYEKTGKNDLAIQEYTILSKSPEERVREEGLKGLKRQKPRD